jgi:copper(I)-binding protein
MIWRRTAFLALLLALLGGTPAGAHEVTVGALKLTNLWTRATPSAAPTAIGFLTITNTGAEPDQLIAVSSPDAASGEFHKMSMENDIMKMRALPGGIEIPAGGTVKLAPGGLHLMFVTLKAPLTEGGKLPVTLTFEKAGKVDTFLHILPIGAKGPDGSGGGHNHEAM